MRKVLKYFTVKTRISWEKNEFERIYNMLMEEGVDAIFVHGRTARPMYSGKAIWNIYNPGYVLSYINDDIHTDKDIETALLQSKANGVIVARGSIGNPWIFSATIPTNEDCLETINKHLDYLYEEYGDYGAIVFRKFIAGYTKDIPGAREFRNIRNSVMKSKSINDLRDAFRKFLFQQ